MGLQLLSSNTFFRYSYGARLALRCSRHHHTASAGLSGREVTVFARNPRSPPLSGKCAMALGKPRTGRWRCHQHRRQRHGRPADQRCHHRVSQVLVPLSQSKTAKDSDTTWIAIPCSYRICTDSHCRSPGALRKTLDSTGRGPPVRRLGAQTAIEISVSDIQTDVSRNTFASIHLKPHSSEAGLSLSSQTSGLI
jgi:hypothetical protein